MYFSRLNRTPLPPMILHRLGQTKIKVDDNFKPMLFHNEIDVEKYHSKIFVDWNITPEAIDENTLPKESYQAILDFQDFTDFFGDLVEKQKKTMTAHSRIANNDKYLALNMLHVQTKHNYFTPVRITVVDFEQNLVYDKIINPGDEVVDFRKCGLTATDLESGHSVEVVQAELQELFQDKCVVGHTLCQFILNFFKPDESLDLAFYNRLHYLIMAITKVRYSGMMDVSEMSNFLLGDSMDDVEPGNSLRYAQTVMQIFYFIVETLQKEETIKTFGIENAKRNEPFDLKKKKSKAPTQRVKSISPQQFYKLVQLGQLQKYKPYKVDWKKQ